MLDNFEYWTLLLLPCFFWAAYYYYKDRHRPEPTTLLILAILLGYGSSYIALFFYESLDYFNFRYDAFELAKNSSFHLFLYAIFAIGPIEEIAKFIPFMIFLVRTPHFDEPLDGVIYASFIALGFSFYENMNYLSVLTGYEAIGRAIASPIVHALFASIWGYAYGYADRNKLNRFLATFIGLLVSMFLHGLYDYFAIGVSNWTHVGPPIIIFIIWMWQLYVIRHDVNKSVDHLK